ncbi:MAG: Hpt domain-containing protein [Chromatiaceae bacterium]|nr:Hpt domain-containing protein [Chromatiaceae bacterium]
MNDTADEEVVEIFAEEAGEVFENIDKHLPIWQRKPTDMDALTEIRRGFHTLKGSGRMVDALDLSEVAWKMENMLNQVIDGKIRGTEPMVALVSDARTLLPRMLDAFKNQQSMDTDPEVETLLTKADALTAGKMPAPERAQPPVAAATTTGEQRISADLEARIERFHQRSDEALRRSEMSLQYARRIATQIEALERDAQDRVGRTEANRIIERVNLLARELLELRRDAKHPQPQPQQPPPRAEINQIVDRRVRERMASVELQRSDITQQLSEARRAAGTAKKLALGALILGTLVGGGAIVALLMSGLSLG